MSAALELEGIAVQLGGRAILRDATLRLEPGELLALAGPNGAGKSTLLRVASRVLPHSRGRVRVAGRPIESFSRRGLAREIAVVPQATEIHFPFSVLEVVLMGRWPHLSAWSLESAEDLALARAAMRGLGIEELADRPVQELSGGERQLAWVARALAQQARVLLLDEPTAHLDLQHRVAVLGRLRDFTRAGGSALVVSHDLSLAASRCDRLALLAEGRVMAVGPAAEVLTPEAVRRAYGVDAHVLAGPDGAPLVVPRASG